MTQALVSELVAIIRRSREGSGRTLAQALGRALERGGFAGVAAEVCEVASRARAFDATDEELSLSIGAILAMADARTGVP